MRSEELIVDAVLMVILAILIFVIGSTFAASGASSFQVFLLCAAIGCGGVALGAFPGLLPKTAGIILGGLAIVLLAILLVDRAHIIPVCGDGICAGSECGVCTKDCAIGMCANGICEPPKESCSNTDDCRCSPAMACSPKDNRSDAAGCRPIMCGDGRCDRDEQCCADCGCAPDFRCSDNMCLFQPPTVTFDVRVTLDEVGATSLLRNPTLTDNQGTPRPIAIIGIGTDGYVRNATLRLTAGPYVRSTRYVGALDPGQNTTVVLYLQPTDVDTLLLSQSGNVTENLTINMEYLDSQRDVHTVRRIARLRILDPGIIDRYGGLVLYVEPVVIRGNDLSGIWDSLSEMIVVKGNTTSIRRPSDVLSSGTANPTEAAIVLASALHTAGLKTSIVEGPAGIVNRPTQVWVRVRSRDGAVTVDPARLGKTLDEAIITTPGFAYNDIDQTRQLRNLTVG